VHICNHFKQMARYNLWADRLLLMHLEPVTDQQYRGDCGLFFKSIHGTLNHLLLGNSAWHGRLADKLFVFDGLDQELHHDRQILADALIAKSEAWIAFIDTLSEQRYSEILTYRTSKGAEVSLPIAPLLGHIFNHATHHRGQVSATISGFGHPVPEMDLVYWLLQAD